MSATETFRISIEQAEAYETQFVPALFEEWAGRLVSAAGVSPGHRVLDIACGTGIVARTAAGVVGDGENVVGLDLNEAMLTVARRVRPDLAWRQGDAARLPFPDRSFDVVLCQSGLMFFPDVEQALREMARVLVDDGRVGIQVWDRRQAQPAYSPFIDVAARHAGPDAIDLLSTYFVRGDLEELRSSLAATGLEPTSIRTEQSTLSFGSIEEMVTTEVRATPLGERLSDDALRGIIEEARTVLDPFRAGSGTLEIPIRGHLVVAQPRPK
ncbi:MAG TPA: methyltransferase domain-containing protein [Actinomycetota bacterium]|nr:methyltransferase domain-containing protein [Actinomycetota bacterium]